MIMRLPTLSGRACGQGIRLGPTSKRRTHVRLSEVAGAIRRVGVVGGLIDTSRSRV